MKFIEELKNPRNIAALVAIILCAFIYLSSQQKITSVSQEYDKKISVYTEEMSKDSAALKTKQVTIDSFALTIYKHSVETSSSSSVKKGTGVKTVVTVIESTDGKKTTTTTSDSFTGEIVDNNLSSKVVDSVANVFKKKTDSLSQEISVLQEKSKVQKIDTVIHEKIVTVIKEPTEKKLDLSALIGTDVSTQNSFIVTPVIGVGARYDFAKIFFVQADVRKVGNIITFGSVDQYKFGTAIGLHIAL